MGELNTADRAIRRLENLEGWIELVFCVVHGVGDASICRLHPTSIEVLTELAAGRVGTSNRQP